MTSVVRRHMAYSMRLRELKSPKKNKLSVKIQRIIERHIGAGLTKEDAVLLGLPSKDYIPLSLEEKIVAHADNLISANKKQTLEELINKWKRNGMDNAIKRLIPLHNELSGLCGIDLDKIQL